MSGLAHYLEDEGVSTVVIALVREHAEQMRPPRALWVPFMLGRPFGAPNDRDQQTAVLRQAFALLQAESGPVLVDADLPVNETTAEAAWVCPVSFADDQQDNPDLSARIEAEIARLRPWYDLGVERRGRTTVGLSPTSLEESARRIADFIQAPGGQTSDPSSAGAALRWSASDLKSYYWEAITAQPGDSPAQQLEDWFWHETAAGEMLEKLRQTCLAHEAKEIRDIGRYMVGDIDWRYYVEELRA